VAVIGSGGMQAKP
jgi:hypothetical protein